MRKYSGLRLAWPAISEVFGDNYIKVLELDRPRLTCEEYGNG